MNIINYHNITTDDMLNGDGLRVVLWCSGCSLKCYNCHNPQTHGFNSGIPFTEETVQELLEALDKPYISGLTLSGGNPLEDENIYTIYNIIKTVKEKFPSKTVWIYTGYTWEEILNKHQKNIGEDIDAFDVVKMCDVLVDGRYVDKLRDISLSWRGSGNQRVIDVAITIGDKAYDMPILYC